MSCQKNSATLAKYVKYTSVSTNWCIKHGAVVQKTTMVLHKADKSTDHQESPMQLPLRYPMTPVLSNWSKFDLEV